ncbi:GNAT family N-acetyltransferase [Shewanella psychrotolerans]|uniref:GNAT family N-acetyltransferase n=1 Tax=Shewanella psychrotolerans TaxID=2864206 RepID=UPI001C6563A7|nr:GNAT family N-acetyltransferase [Shewanella psychrotolerans]QYK01084.1 GNAT family N-acetyltransferase [Shewanella psychrotolerans]
MQWNDYGFIELTTEQLYELIKLRIDVFVVEQNCPYPELDGKDSLADTRHLLGCDKQGRIVAYARILAPGVSYPDASIGRVLVAEYGRGGGVAHQLMQNAIAVARAYWPDANIQIGAQEYLADFYQRQGFMQVSDVYLEDGIPHMDMLLS